MAVSMGLRPVGRDDRRLAELAYNQILHAVLDGIFQSGDRLIMDRLAEELEMSRTPVREALQRMQNDGLLVAAAKGYTIRGVTASDVAAMYQAREPVEGFAARLVAQTGEQHRPLLEGALCGLNEAQGAKPSDQFLANRAFHRATLEAVANPVLLDCFDTIWGRGMAVLSFAETARSGPQVSEVAEHRQLLEALLSDDPNRAEEETLAHIRRGAASVDD